MYRVMAQGTRKLNSGTQADTDAIVSSYFSGSARRQTRSARQRQCQCFHLKVTVVFDLIHERSGPAQAQLQSIGRFSGVGVEKPLLPAVLSTCGRFP